CFAPFFRRQIVEARRAREGGVVDDDVDATEALEGAPHYLLSNAGGGDIARHRQGALADRCRQRLGTLAVAHIHRHRCAALVEALRGGAADTAPGASNDDDPSDEVLCHSRSDLSKAVVIRTARLRWAHSISE